MKPTSTDGSDLLISFDDTGSMSSVRRQVRENIKSLVKDLKSQVPGLRVGVIIHNDYCDAPRHIFVQDFTTDEKTILDFVAQDSPCGGGDAPECYELALNKATSLNWQNEKRAMILIGDEEPHRVGYSARGITNSFDWRTEADKLSSMGVKIYSVQALGRKHATYFYDELGRKTGGTKLDLSQFAHISTYITAVTYHQQGGTQLEDYEKSNPAFASNLALRNMFRKLKGGSDDKSFLEKVELLSRFQVMNVDGATAIRDFVEMNGCTFKKGRGFYQLVERTADGKSNVEEIQPAKEVIFVNKETGEATSDTSWCREQLKVPFGTRGKVHPLQIADVMNKYEVYVQSTSVNRKLDPGTKFLYELEAR